jgi:hypothetical protein
MIMAGLDQFQDRQPGDVKAGRCGVVLHLEKIFLVFSGGGMTVIDDIDVT